METQIKFHHAKIIIFKKIDKNWATKINKCHNFGLFLSPNQFQNATNCGSNKHPNNSDLPLTIYLFDNRRFLSQSLKDHNNRVFSRWDDRPKVRCAWPTDGPAMPLPRFRAQVALRCVAGFLDARESGSLVVALVDKTRMKFEMRCLVVIPLSLPCLLDSKVTHFEWVGNRLMMKQEEAVGASDLCASSSSG